VLIGEAAVNIDAIHSETANAFTRRCVYPNSLAPDIDLTHWVILSFSHRQ
jgi:hypothetical protein